MKMHVTLLRTIALAAATAGYTRQWISAAASVVADTFAPTRNWSERDMDGVTIKVPRSWGEVEQEPTGPVVYNRPRRFRVDGDAVWYSSAIEIRVRRTEAPGLSSEAPMSELSRALPFNSRVVVTAAMANGLSRQPRRTVDRILRSARPSSKRS